MAEKQLEYYFFLIVFLLAAALVAFLFAPFLSAIAIAAVFAVLFYPVHRWVLAHISGRDGVAAAATLAFVIIVILLPLSVLGYFIVEQSQSLYQSLGAGPLGIERVVEPIEAVIQSYVPAFSVSIDVESYVRDAASFIAQNVGSVFTSAVQVVFSLFLGILVLYYFLKDGKKFVRTLVRFSPLEDHYDWSIASRLEGAINSVVRGSITIAIIQGVLAGIGFTIFGVPNPALWGSVTAVSALIPGIGTALVMLPVLVYLFFTAPLWAVVGMAIWSAAAVSTIDNILSPKLIGGRAHIHPLFVLLSVLGGIALLGPAGFFIGPLAIAALYVLGDIYLSLFAESNPSAHDINAQSDNI